MARNGRKLQGPIGPPGIDVTRHMGIVGEIVARGRRRQHADREDTLQDGMVGLVRAGQLYDPACGHAFSTYAWGVIRGWISFGKRKRWPVHIPSHALLLSRKVDRGDLSAEGLSDWDKETLRCARDVMRRSNIQDGPHDGRRTSLFDVCAERDAEPEGLAAAEELGAILARANLTPRERAVLDAYAGLDGRGGLGLAEIGQEMGFTRQRAQFLHSSAMRKLKVAASKKAEAA